MLISFLLEISIPFFLFFLKILIQLIKFIGELCVQITQIVVLLLLNCHIGLVAMMNLLLLLTNTLQLIDFIFILHKLILELLILIHLVFGLLLKFYIRMLNRLNMSSLIFCYLKNSQSNLSNIIEKLTNLRIVTQLLRFMVLLKQTLYRCFVVGDLLVCFFKV